jgi:nucleotide-binding universal stress UspA family protein
MTIKTILVGASGGTASDGAIELACQIARRFDAHLEGFHVRPDPRQLAIVVGAGGFNMPIDSSWADQMAIDAATTAATTRTAFTTALARHGLKVAEAPPQVGPSAAWRDETGYAPLLVSRRARFFDLVVLGRSERVIEQPHTNTIEEVLIHSGRPVLLAPAHPAATMGNSIAVAWNGSPQAVRALTATLPLLAAARAVTIVTVSGAHEESATSVKQYLGWQGISGNIRHVSRLSGTGPGDQLLVAARDEGADLLVMGGYGRTPWRELLFGGATREVVSASVLPLLISH